MRQIIFSLIFLALAATRVCAGDEHQAISEFVQASDLYKQGKYSEAISAYHKVLDQGFESGELYYNLANAYYRDGQVGYAVLNHERAAQLMPRDRDLRFNNRYLLSRHPEIQWNQQRNFLGRAIDKHIEFYTLNEMTEILFGLFVCAGLLGLAAFHWRWMLSTVIVVSVLMSTVIGVYAAGFAFKINDVRNKAIVIHKASARFEPRVEATEHFQLPEGSMVKILKQEDGWTKIQRGDKKQGWVLSENVEKVGL